MNTTDRRRFEVQIRVSAFGSEHTADFSGITATMFAELAVLIDKTDEKSAAQQSGFGESAQQFRKKENARVKLRDHMTAISRTSKSMVYAIDGIAKKFTFQRNLPDRKMLARARAFHTEALVYEADFIEYGLPATFRADLNTAADAFETSFAHIASATAEHVSATAETIAKVAEGMTIVRILDGLVKNRYATDPGKLAAWHSVSRIEKRAKKKEIQPLSDG